MFDFADVVNPPSSLPGAGVRHSSTGVRLWSQMFPLLSGVGFGRGGGKTEPVHFSTFILSRRVSALGSGCNLGWKPFTVNCC